MAGVTYSQTYTAAGGYLRGSNDGNGFYMILRWAFAQNEDSNSTTVYCSYIIQNTVNPYSGYTATTYLQKKTNADSSYVDLYRPSTTISYSMATASTTNYNAVYWIGNNTRNQESQIYNPPTTAYQFSFVVNHDATGAAPATSIKGYFDSNTSESYNVDQATATATLTTYLPNYRVLLKSGSSISVSALSRPTTSTLNITASTVYTNTGVSPTYEYSLDNGSTWQGAQSSPSWTNIAITAAQQYTVKVKSYTAEDAGIVSSGASSPGIPNAPIIQAVSKNAKQVSITWTAGSSNGSTVSGYRVEGSYDDFSTIHYSANISGATSLSHTTTDLTIAQTYKFRVITTSNVGDSEPSAETDGLFISAYGYRYNGTDFSTAIQSAKIFVGVGGPGADEDGWRTVQGVQRWNGSSWIDLQT